MNVFWLLGAYAGGILLADVQKSAADPWLCLPGLLLLITWALLHRSSWGALPAVGAWILLGFVWTGLAHAPPAGKSHVAAFVDQGPVVLEGIMQDLARFSDGRSRFDLDVARIHQGTSTARVSGRVRVSVRQGEVHAVEGQTLRLRCSLRPPHNFGTPGEFDYTGHLASRGIFATAHLAEARQIVPLVDESSPGSAGIATFRRRLAARIGQALPGPEAGLVQALVIGMRDGITPGQRQILSEGGVAHLFAISGLHFGLLGLLLYLFCRWLYCRSTFLLLCCPPRRVIPLLLLLPMAGYLFLTGNSLPTRRAFYMTAAASLLYSSSRRTPPLWLLATAALVILLNEPLAFFQPSFQLSFAGLFGILFWLPAWQKPFIDKPLYLRWPVMLFLTTLAATLATAPLTLWHFHIFAPAGLLTNLAATPLLAWGAVPVGLMGVVLSPIFPQAADLCFEGSGALVAVTFRMVETMAALPGLTARYHFASLSDIVAMVLLLVSVSIPCRSWSGKLLCGVLLTGGLAISLGLPEESPSLQVVALSVGQGDATLLSFSAGQHYLIDGGGLPGSGFDPGERLVAPALGRLNVKRLQGVILTHDHPDHRDGLKYILEHFAVDAFFSGQAFADLDPALRETLMRRNIPVKTLKAQWTTLSSEEDLQLQIFTPRQNHPDINECSLVIYAGLGEDGVLLTGDMGAEGLEQLLAAGLPGPANLLKLPHHGSRGSDPARYLHDIAPQIAFVSAGRNNPYNLPHPQTLENCRDRHIPVFRTDTDGTLGFRSTGAGWTTPQRPEGFSVDEN